MEEKGFKLVNKRLENDQMIEYIKHMIKIYEDGFLVLKRQTTHEAINKAKALKSDIYGVKVILVSNKLRVSYHMKGEDIQYEYYFDYSPVTFNGNIITDDIALAICISLKLKNILYQTLRDAMEMDVLLTKQILEQQQLVLEQQQLVLEQQYILQQQILHQQYILQQQYILHQQQQILQQRQDLQLPPQPPQQMSQQMSPQPPLQMSQQSPQPQSQPQSPQYNSDSDLESYDAVLGLNLEEFNLDGLDSLDIEE